MKEFLHKIVRSFRLDRRDVTGLLLSLLLASSIWVLHNLSLKYTDYVTVSVVAKSSIDGRTEFSTNSADITARARCIGYSLLKVRFNRNESIVIPFREDEFHYEGGDVFYLTSKELHDHVKDFYGDGSVVETDGFVTDTVRFRFSTVSHKKVPVTINGSFTPDENYTFKGDVKLYPDSVTVYGESSRIALISEVMTKRVYKTGIDKAHSGTVKLQKVRDIRYSSDAVRYSYEVTRFVDIERTASLHVINKPMDKDIFILPSVVDVRFRCKFPYVGDPVEDAVLYVDYEDYLESRSGKCPVKVMNAGSDVLEYAVEPEYVELIEQ